MQRSLNTGVTALKSNQTELDVIANNIANVNTVGYKKQRALMATTFSDVMRTASQALGSKGGTNPAEVGLGTKVSAIDTIHTQGTLQSTGRSLDIAIQGEGFFTVTDGIKDYYTRSGALNVSPSDGSFTIPNGYKVLGYIVDPTTGEINTNLGLQVIKAPTSEETVVSPTSKITFANNIDKNLAVGDKVTIPCYAIDSLGTKHTLSLDVTITGVGQADWQVSSPEGLALANNSGTLTFDTQGKLSASTGGPVTATPIGADPLNVDMDFNQVSYLDNDTELSVKSQDGMEPGILQEYVISDNGLIQCSYSNGVVKTIARIPVTTFDNPSGLYSVGDTLFTESNNSGRPIVTVTGEDKESTIVSEYLEASNVDVSDELTQMIKTERAYQMGSSVVKTSDEILQDLINLKR